MPCPLVVNFSFSMATSCCTTLHFDDIEKRKKYETILFKEVYNEVVEIKVILLP
jgi:hypothetical protein